MTTTIEVPAGTSVLNITQESGRVIIEFAPRFKEGDFVYRNGRIMIIHKYPQLYKALVYLSFNTKVYYNGKYGFPFSSSSFRFATEEEKKIFLDALEKDGKKWNAEKLCIEDIHQRKFNPGDKVKLKDGILDKNDESLYFAEDMHVFIGKVLTVGSYTSKGYLYLNEGNGWAFEEDWFELYSDEPIVGELAIFWDSRKEYSCIRLYTGNITPPEANQRVYLSTRRIVDNQLVGEWTDPVPISEIDGQSGEDGVDIKFIHRDHLGVFWENALKFISKEQFLEHIKD